MKNLILLSVLGMIALSGCQKRPDSTISNMQQAVIDEATASVTYTAFEVKATEENLPTIAKMFQALARSEHNHAERYKEFLDEWDVNVQDFDPNYALNDTRKNLLKAIEMESYCVDSLYPKCLKDAQAESQTEISEMLQWASNVEKKHLELLQNALKMYDTQRDSLQNLPNGYTVCPICGCTKELSTPVDNCKNCGTSGNLLIQL